MLSTNRPFPCYDKGKTAESDVHTFRSTLCLDFEQLLGPTGRRWAMGDGRRIGLSGFEFLVLLHLLEYVLQHLLKWGYIFY